MKNNENCNLGKYGGQAVIEGVMMMGKNKYATAVRKLNGEIFVEKQEHIRITDKHKWLNIPILRGCVSFFDTMLVGIKCLMKSAEEFEIEEENTMDSLKEKEENKEDEKIPEWALVLTLIISLAFSIGLFILLPSLVANLIKNILDNVITNDLFYSLIESALRIIIFLGYLYIVSFQGDIKRVFEYHGAEHKTINCLEDGKDLTVENAKTYSRLNPRCGTSFLFLVMIISIIIYSIPMFKIRTNIFITVGIRLVLLPLIAGVSYELIKILGKSTGKFAKAISKPGMWLQTLTTREPDEEQLEVAIMALKETMQDK